MLQITIPATEIWDEKKQEFVYKKQQTLQLEHSLVSLSKWESKWRKPFLTKEEKTREESLDYIRCMTITQNVDPDIYQYLSNTMLEEIYEYIAAPMTATVFSDNNSSKGKGKREIVTSEIIYYWMIALQIPYEYRKWHLNQLITLIRVCEIKNQPPKKRNSKDIASHYAALNAARKKKHNTKG